jgi:hypothetical protein
MPTNRLNPTKCPFCGPSTLACGWPGHNEDYPSPQAVALALAAPPSGGASICYTICGECGGKITMYPQPFCGKVLYWTNWHSCGVAEGRP